MAGARRRYYPRVSLPIWDWPPIIRMFQTLASPAEGESTAIGLALVKKIVERYRGKV